MDRDRFMTGEEVLEWGPNDRILLYREGTPATATPPNSKATPAV